MSLHFGRYDEADLDGLRNEGVALLSLVAELRKQIVGHILFSRIWIDNAVGSIATAALAPVALLPVQQRKGIGGRLIRRGLDSLRDRGERIVIVLRRPDYYWRFGFSAEKERDLISPFPADAFMAAELSVDALAGNLRKREVSHHIRPYEYPPRVPHLMAIRAAWMPRNWRGTSASTAPTPEHLAWMSAGMNQRKRSRKLAAKRSLNSKNAFARVLFARVKFATGQHKLRVINSACDW
jgi:putative acetyltransferase